MRRRWFAVGLLAGVGLLRVGAEVRRGLAGVWWAEYAGDALAAGLSGRPVPPARPPWWVR